MSHQTLSSAGAKDRARLALWSVITTGISLIPTGYAAYLSTSVTLVADLLQCAVEFLAIFLSWLVMNKIAREDSSRFNYGYGKLEQFSRVVVAFALSGSGIVALSIAIHRILEPAVVSDYLFGLIFAALSVLGNLAFCLMHLRFHRAHPSPVSDAQWKLFRAKTFATTLVLLTLSGSALFGEHPWSVYFDPVGSITLAVILFHSAYGLFADSMSDLFDRAVAEQIQLIIMRALIKNESGYTGFREVRTRRSGNVVFVQIVLTFNETSKLGEVRDITKQIESEIRTLIPNSDVTVIPEVQTAH